MPQSARDPGTKTNPRPSCPVCSREWCDDPSDERHVEDRSRHHAHILELRDIEEVRDHVTQRCVWFYGGVPRERLEGDVRAALATWTTHRELEQIRRVADARAVEPAIEGPEEQGALL